MNASSRALEAVLLTAGCVVIIAGIKQAEAIVVPFLLSIFLATIAAGPIAWLRSKRIPNAIAIALVVISLLLLLTGFAVIFTNAVAEFTARQESYELRIKELSTKAIELLSVLGFSFSSETLSTVINPSQVILFLSQALSRVGGIISNGLIIGLTVVFILAEGANLPRRLKRVLQERQNAFMWLDHFASTLNRYLAVKTSVSLATGVLIGAYLWSLGVDFPVLWGVLAFMLNYIPNIGSALAAIPAILVALVQLGVGPSIATLAGFVVANVFMGAVVEPRFMGRVLGLSALVVFLSLIFWGWMLGPVGMLLSVPLTMTVKLAMESNPSTVWIATLLGPVDSEIASQSTSDQSTSAEIAEK